MRLEGDATPESGIVEVVGKKVNGSCIKTMRCTRLEGDFGERTDLYDRFTTARADMGNYDGLQKLIANSEYKVLFTTQATAH